MRPIEFRAWDVKNKRMWWNVQNAYDTMEHHCCPGECTLEDRDLLLHDSFGEVLKDKNLIVMQSTSLVDVDRKKIFKGDLVIGVNGNVGGPSEVFFDYGVWQPFSFIGNYNGSRYEVIGNVYQNPELLEAKKL